MFVRTFSPCCANLYFTTRALATVKTCKPGGVDAVANPVWLENFQVLDRCRQGGSREVSSERSEAWDVDHTTYPPCLIRPWRLTGPDERFPREGVVEMCGCSGFAFVCIRIARRCFPGLGLRSTSRSLAILGHPFHFQFLEFEPASAYPDVERHGPQNWRSSSACVCMKFECWAFLHGIWFFSFSF